MTKVIMKDQDHPEARYLPAPARGWRMLWWVGVLFTAVGFVDLLLVWYPAQFGTAEWVAFLNGLPVPTIGVLLMSASAVSMGWGRYFWFGMALLALALGLILMAGILFGTTFPIALKMLTDPTLLAGVKKAVLKSFFQLFFYLTAYLVTIRVLWQWREKGEPVRAG